MIASNLFLAVCIPWLLGFAMVRPLLKRRYGWLFLGLGAGYIVGMYTTTLLLRLYDYYERAFDFTELIIIELIITLPLLFFLRVKPCLIDELRLEKPASNPVKAITLLFILFICFRLGVIFIDVLERPLLPWDAWFSWSAKAKIFYYDQAITTLYSERVAWWEFTQASANSVGGISHPIFLPLLQTFFALAYGSWNDSIINIPWVVLGLALVMIIYGSLRYLGVGMLLSIFAAYFVFSLPMLSVQLSLGSYGGIWIATAFSLAVFSLSACLVLSERRMYLLCFAGIVIMYASKHTSAYLLPVFILMFIYARLGTLKTSLLLLLCVAPVVLMELFFPKILFPTLGDILNIPVKNLDIFYLNKSIIKETLYNLFVIDNWHYLFFIVPISLLFLCLKTSNNPNSQAMRLIIVAGVSSCGLFIWLTHFTSHIPPTQYFGYVNRAILYFVPIFTLVPICIFQITRDRTHELPMA